MDNCIFCKIAKGDIPSETVFENERIRVFKDINPAAPVHLLMVPKKHIATLSHATAEDAALLGEMMALIPEIAKQNGLAVKGDTPDAASGGFRVVINAGPDASQEVYHLHIHIMGGKRPWKRG